VCINICHFTNRFIWRHAWTIAMPFSLGHPSPPQTNSSEYWMLPLASSVKHGSTTADSPVSCTMSCSGWTFLSGCSTSCVLWSVDVCSTKHHSTWQTAASIPQTFVGSICGPPAVINCLYRDTGIWCLVVVLFLWPARRPGTRYQATCEICLVLLTVFAGT